MVIPRVMFEVERQLQAVEFYGNLVREDRSIHLPVDLCVESLAAVTAGLPYNYERLELLGDSFLKVSVSIDLMANEEHLREGRLSQRRQAKISNVNLHRIGISEGIHRYAAFTPFSPKIWTPPGIESLIRHVFTTNPTNISYLDGLNDASKNFREKLLKVMVDPELRWKLLKALEERTANREEAWTLTHDGKLLAPASRKGTKDASAGITRYGMSIPNKFISDLVEASVGAFYQALGIDATFRYLIGLGILTPKILTVDGISKLRVMGSLRGDPRDVFPMVQRNRNHPPPKVSKGPTAKGRQFKIFGKPYHTRDSRQCKWGKEFG